MTPDNTNHVLPMIDAYLAGGLDDAERKAFDAHVATCGDCAAAVDSARAAGDRLADALVGALPLPDFENRLIGALRPRMSRPSFVQRLSRPIRHPAVRKIAVGLAASLVIGTVGFGMSQAVDTQAQKDPGIDVVLDASHSGEVRLKDGIDIVGGTSIAESTSTPTRHDDILRYPADWPDASKVRTDSRILEQDARSLAYRDNIYSKSAGGRRNDTILLPEDTARANNLSAADEVKSLAIRQKELNGETSAREDEVRLGRTPPTDEKKFFGEQNAALKAGVAELAKEKEELRTTAQTLSESLVEGTESLEKSRKLAAGSRSGKLADDYGLATFETYRYTKSTATPTTPTGESNGRHDGTTVRGVTVVDASGPAKGDKQSGATATNGPAALYFDAPQVDYVQDSGGRAAGAGSGAASAGGLPAITSKTESESKRLADFTPTQMQLGSIALGDGRKPADGPSDGWGNTRWYRPQAENGKWNDQLSSESLARGKDGKGVTTEPKFGKEVKAAEGFTNTTGLSSLSDNAELKAFTVTGGDKDADRAKVEELYAGVALKNPEVAGSGGDGIAVKVPDGGTLRLGGQTLAAGADGDPTGATTASKSPPPPATTDPQPGRVASVQPPPPVQVRKVIRNGVVTFEVDSFDSALIQVGKLAAEEGGFIQTTSSDKLQNGKVRGAVTVRVPPDRLDTLVLKLRGMGDLKNQRISAEDVTKRYTDIESQLRAALAMEKRLLEIISKGGEVKDLLEAEKQLGVWREKLEILQGEIKYFDNLISLSTLVIELMERDVRTPTAAFEVETVNTAVETEDVENVRSEILKSIEAAKGRVIDSDLKKLEAGQLSATIKATVAPDAAGPVIDRLKQLGKLARLDISRKTATEGGSGPIVPGLRVERRETQFEINIYNLANIEPRQMTTLSLAAQDVEATYKQIIDQVKSAGGDIRTSQLNRPKADQTSGTIVFQAPADKADVLLGAIRTGVDVMRMDVATNPDARNTTDAKRGFSVQISSLSHVPARETTTLQVASADVPSSFRKLLDAATAAGGRVLTSQLNEQDANNITGTIEFETPRDKWPAIDTLLRDAGAIVSRSATRSSDTENTVDSKLKLSISLMDEIRLSPRETINATVATRTVQETFDKLLTAAKSAGARVVGSNLNLADRARPTGSLRFAVPRENADKFEQSMKDAGLTTSRAVARLPDGPMTVENKVGFIVTVVDERTLQARESQSMVVVAASASDRYAKLLEALRIADALVLNSQLSVQNKKDITGTLEFVINRSDRGIVDSAIGDGADVFNRNVDRSQDTQGTVDTKIRYAVTIREADQQPPRQIVQLSVQSAGIDKAVGDIEAAAIAAGGRKIEAERSRQDRKDAARVVIDVPLAKLGEIITAVRGQGEVTSNQSRQNEAVPEGSLSRARIEVSYTTPPTAAADKSFGESLREGLSGALTGLFTILRWVIFGLVVIVPCLLIVWFAYKLVAWTRPRKRDSQPTATPA